MKTQTTSSTIIFGAFLFGLITPLKAGIIEPFVVWDKKAIVTCWYDSAPQLALTRIKSEEVAREKYDFVPKELSKREKRKVMEAVNLNFTPSRTGIHFVGWKGCSQTPNPDLIVMEAKSKIFIFDRPDFNGRAVIGEEGVSTTMSDGSRGFWIKSGRVSNIALYTQNRGTVVHEFGHVAGLRHEHIHEDAFSDERCENRIIPLDFGKPETIEKPYSTAIFHTTYDPNSIMNYCWLMTERSRLNRKGRIILSEKDQATLRHYYQ
jgi:hypothetical protein